ncbi:MAG: hypothetical protein GEV09_24950 [Pseudonocardiaceae bacterium]|nr:hypothetical protein [Pseudonocardiaceae bacterium]
MTGAASIRGLRDAMGRKGAVLIVVGVLLVAGVATVAAVVGQRLLAPEPAAPPPAAAAGPSATTNPPAGMVEFRQPEAGFALSYPADWTRLQSSDKQVVLLAAAGQQESFLVRVLQLDAAVGPQQLPAAKQVTDQIVKSNKSVKLLAQPKQIELGGLPGYFYFYSFQDPKTGKKGAHTHFFVFNDKKMISMVFQAVPLENFQSAAPTFDKITNSFRVLQQ